MKNQRRFSWRAFIQRDLQFNYRSQRGMVESIILGAIGLGVSVGVIYIGSKFRTTMMGLEKTKGASAEIEMVMNRISQAVAMNAILCASPLPGVRSEGQCRWTEDPLIKPADFGFQDIPTGPQKVFKFTAKACIPKSEVLGNDCVPSLATVALDLVNTAPLISSGLLGGHLSSGDVDPWAIRMVVGADVVGQTVVGADNVAHKVHKEGSAVLRRPRMFVHFELSPGICQRKCELSDSLSNLRTCVGPVEATSDTGSASGAIIPVRFVNDGPGHLHHFTIKRTFFPNLEYAPAGTPAALPSEVVFDSAAGKPEGLPVGQAVDFVDDKTPCYIKNMFNPVVSTTQTGSTTVQEVSRKSSGSVLYELVVNADNLDPANVLYMSPGNGAVQAQDRTTTQFITPPIPIPFCTSHPTDPSCLPVVPTNCITNPSDPMCTALTFCQMYPADPSCNDPCGGGCYTGDGGAGGGGDGGGGGGGCGGADGG